MPLNHDAARLIRADLEEIQKGNKAPVVRIGTLTDRQLNVINTERKKLNLPAITGEILFVGRHIYKRRILVNGYSIDDVIEQATSAMDSSSVFHSMRKMTIIENPNPRDDGYGNKVTDQAVFECSSRHPRAELFSVIPIGDGLGPGMTITRKSEKGHEELAALVENLTDSPG